MAREKLFYGVLCGALIATVSVKAASTYSYVTISKGQSSVQSEAVGVSTSAKYFALNKSTSSGALGAYACWVGWPYTLEYSASLQPGDSVTHYEPQDKNSSFYVKLVGNGLCDGSAYVEAK